MLRSREKLGPFQVLPDSCASAPNEQAAGIVGRVEGPVRAQAVAPLLAESLSQCLRLHEHHDVLALPRRHEGYLRTGPSTTERLHAQF